VNGFTGLAEFYAHLVDSVDYSLTSLQNFKVGYRPKLICTYTYVEFLPKHQVEIVLASDGLLLGLHLEEGAYELRRENLSSEAVLPRFDGHNIFLQIRSNK